MNTWLTPMCQWHATEEATTFGITLKPAQIDDLVAFILSGTQH